LKKEKRKKGSNPRPHAASATGGQSVADAMYNILRRRAPFRSFCFLATFIWYANL
jgi:hypothetical protein